MFPDYFSSVANVVMDDYGDCGIYTLTALLRDEKIGDMVNICKEIYNERKEEASELLQEKKP